MLTVDILLFDGVEVMDFAAPFEIFSLVQTRVAPNALRVRTVGPSAQIRCRNNLVVCPAAPCSADDAPDCLVLPGGPGVEPLIASAPETMDYVARLVPRCRWVLAICSGSLILAKLGLLRDRAASSHHSDLDRLRALDSSVRVAHGSRFVQDGHIITSDGISSGLDASLFLLSAMLGREVADTTANWAEYQSRAWDRHGSAYARP